MTLLVHVPVGVKTLPTPLYAVRKGIIALLSSHGLFSIFEGLKMTDLVVNTMFEIEPDKAFVVFVPRHSWHSR
jgi:hypothetical protein